MQTGRIRVVVGDRVAVAMTSYDLNLGQIVYRFTRDYTSRAQRSRGTVAGNGVNHT
jgi:hypothetical protein